MPRRYTNARYSGGHSGSTRITIDTQSVITPNGNLWDVIMQVRRPDGDNAAQLRHITKAETQLAWVSFDTDGLIDWRTFEMVVR